jgi:hypothetical protein
MKRASSTSRWLAQIPVCAKAMWAVVKLCAAIWRKFHL